MNAGRLRSDISYVRNLVEAGYDGAMSARKSGGERMFTPARARVVWRPAAIGAALGILIVCLDRNQRRTNYRVAIGGLLGSALGIGGGIAWTSRRVTGAAARGAIERISVARDEHWLEKNPITYA